MSNPKGRKPFDPLKANLYDDVEEELCISLSDMNSAIEQDKIGPVSSRL